jgi:hypothetical protein
MKQRVALDNSVLAVVRMLDESVGLSLRQIEAVSVVAYAESETVTGARLEGHSRVAKTPAIEC